MSGLIDKFDTWMAENFCGEFESLRGRATPGDEDIMPELRFAWERKMGEAGWVGVGWPKEHGGKGASLEELVAFNEVYARHGGPGRNGHIGETLFAPTLIAYGTDAQKAKYLPGIKNGTELWCQGYSEPNAGSDLSNIKTKARLDGDEWVVDGQKIWTSLAMDADYVFVIARAEEGTVGRHGLVFLLMKLDQAGIDIRPIKQISETAEFNEVFFDSARCHKDDMIGGVGDGWKIAMALLGFERGASTLGQQMTFTNEFESIVKLAKENGAAHDPTIRQRIAKAYCGLKVMRMTALRTLEAAHHGELSREGYMSKIYWATWHRDLGELAMDVMGPDAELLKDGEYGMLHKLFLFSRSDTIYGGTNQIQRNIIAERALGMPKEPRGKPK
ncbi:MAG: acyl-CoA dehydrogenase [Hellea sp.]|nr:acyl-CoA dehydrogenase [Hellea sp.]